MLRLPGVHRVPEPTLHALLLRQAVEQAALRVEGQAGTGRVGYRRWCNGAARCCMRLMRASTSRGNIWRLMAVSAS